VFILSMIIGLKFCWCGFHYTMRNHKNDFIFLIIMNVVDDFYFVFLLQEVFWHEEDNGEPKRQLFYESGYSVRERNKRWAKLQFRKI